MGQIFDRRETVMGAAIAGAHGLRECERAMARRRRQFADLGYPLTPMLAVVLARAVDGTDFRPSTNTLSMRSPNANLIYSSSRVSQVSCEHGRGFVEGSDAVRQSSAAF